MQTAHLNHKQDAHTNNGAYPQSYTSHGEEDPERGDGKVGFVRDVLLRGRGEGRGGGGGGGGEGRGGGGRRGGRGEGRGRGGEDVNYCPAVHHGWLTYVSSR